MQHQKLLHFIVKKLIDNAQNSNWIINIDKNKVIWNHRGLPFQEALETFLSHYASEGKDFYFYKDDNLAFKIPTSVGLETNWIYVEETDAENIPCSFLEMIANALEDEARDKRKLIALQNNLKIKNEVCEEIDFITEITYHNEVYPISTKKDLFATVKDSLEKCLDWLSGEFLCRNFSNMHFYIKMDNEKFPLFTCSLKTLEFLSEF